VTVDLDDIVKKAAKAHQAESPKTELREIALAAAKAADEARDVGTKASELKKVLFDAMKKAGTTEVAMPDRGPIRIKTIKRPQQTLGVLKEALGDAEANRIWSLFPRVEHEELDIPKPNAEPSV
jgi:hypothetical protein